MTAQRPTAARWVLRPRPAAGARVRLFCFPYAGGGTSIYRAWPSVLPLEIELCAVALPGREGRIREQPFSQLPELVDALVEGLAAEFEQGPFAFFGHSMGALIAFELARALFQRCGPAPAHLFVSGRKAPHLPDPVPPIHALPDDAFVAELRRLSGTPEAVLQNPELMQLVLPALRADFALIERYVYHPAQQLRCPISAFAGSDDPEVRPDEVAAWCEHGSGAFRLRTLPGDHFFLHAERALLAAAIAEDLLPLWAYA